MINRLLRGIPFTPRNIQAPFLMIVAGFCFIAIAIFMVITQAGQPAQNSIAPPKIGQPFGDFALMDLNGATVRLSDYRGKVVLVNVWATWCPPCRSEMPTLQSYYIANKEKGFEVLAINAGETQADARSFTSQYGLSFPILLDPDIALIKRLAIFDYPTSILVGRDGVVKNIQIGLYRPEAVKSDIDRYLMP